MPGLPRCACAILGCAFYFPLAANAGYMVLNGTTWTGSFSTGYALGSLNMRLFLPRSVTAIANSTMTLDYYTPGGVLAGTATVTTDAAGEFSVPPPPIPATATPDGGYVQIYGAGGYTKAAPLKMTWSNGFFDYLGFGTGFHPFGLPGVTPEQTWSFVDPGLTSGDFELSGDSIVQSFSGSVAASNFDVSYLMTGPETYEAYIDDNNSYLEISDGSFIALPEGVDFGSITYTSADAGTFDFFGLGISGTWTFDSSTDITSGIITAAVPFEGEAVTGVEVAPEPGTLWLLAAGATGFIALRRGCRWAYSGVLKSCRLSVTPTDF